MKLLVSEENKSMCHKRKEIKKLMNSQGFNLIRKKNHLIWRDDFGNQVVTPSSASDFRTINTNLAWWHWPINGMAIMITL